ncbi:hypothetical protein IAT40_002295 [Kwoniella sp. CBS 6097]
MTTTSQIPKPFTFTYDTVNDIKLDLYIPPSASQVSESTTGDGSRSLPAVVAFHGGGMIAGAKDDIFVPFDLFNKFLAKDVLVIPANYRLLFPSTAEEIISDVGTLFMYLSSPSTALSAELAKHSLQLDIERLAVLGISGGNYPARAAATIPTIIPRPKAWFSLYGIAGDFLLDHWVQAKSPDQAFKGFNYDAAAAQELIDNGGGPVIHDAPYMILPGTGVPGDKAHRGDLSIAIYLNGTFLDCVLNEPGISDKVRQQPYEQRYSLIPESKRRYLLPISADTAPAVFVHGTSDTMAPLQEALTALKDLEKYKVDASHAWVEGAEHGLVDPAAWPNRHPGADAAEDEAIWYITEKLLKVRK